MGVLLSSVVVPSLCPSPGGSRSRLLLRDTVNSPQPPDQRLRGQAKNTAIWKDLLQNRQGALVVRTIVGRYQHHPIGNVKIRIAGWQACGRRPNRARHGEWYDL